MNPRVTLSSRHVLALGMVVAALASPVGGVVNPGPARGVSPSDPVLFAAGDVARCVEPNGADDTAALIEAVPGAHVAVLGDGAYPNGTMADYTNCYGPHWGPFYDRTLPVPGNHDYKEPGAPGYWGYWGNRFDDPGFSETATDTTKGFYSYEIGPWHVVALNANCGSIPTGCGKDSLQWQWLQADLAAHRSECIIGMWHHARFYSSADGSGPTPFPSSDTKMSRYWEVLRSAGADIVLSGHDHFYERFARMASDNTSTTDEGRVVAPAENGMRNFVVGTGGGELQTFSTAPGKDLPATGSEFRKDQTYGVLRLDLHAGSYGWRFIVPDGTVIDSGSDSCTPGQTPPPTAPPTAPTTTATTTPTKDPVPGPTTTTTPAPSSSRPRSGYWMLGEDGAVYPFGDARRFTDPSGDPGGAVDLEATPSGDGYRILARTGAVSAFGDARDLVTGPVQLRPGESMTSLSTTPTGAGYWLFTDAGRVIAVGDATHLGDVSHLSLNGPVVDSVATPSGEGYYMVASDGGIFAFGDARFAGSMGGQRLNAPVQSLVPDADGAGYWLVASDGGVFAFEAAFRGSMGATPLNKSVVGMVRNGSGYLMVGADGGIFNFSDQPFLGSLGDHPPAVPVTAVAVLWKGPV